MNIIVCDQKFREINVFTKSTWTKNGNFWKYSYPLSTLLLQKGAKNGTSLQSSKFLSLSHFLPLCISIDLMEFLKTETWRNWIIKWFHGMFLKQKISWKYSLMIRWFHGILLHYNMLGVPYPVFARAHLVSSLDMDYWCSALWAFGTKIVK